MQVLKPYALISEIEHLQAENALLRSRSPIQLYSSHSAPASPKPVITEWVISPDMLRQMLGMADVDLINLTFVNDQKHQLSSKERARAEQIVNTTAFRHWITSPSSTKLMVYWDHCRRVANMSSLAIFCATMATALQAQSGRFLSALWFCGRHHDRAEVQSEMVLGPRAILKGLIDQLLRQYAFNMHPVSRCTDFATLQSGGLDASGGLTLLENLLLQVPPVLTLFFVIDGVVLFEREQFIDKTILILGRLVSFTEDPRVRCTVKVLLTSAPRADAFAFAAENLTLNVDNTPLAEFVPSEERLARELNA